MYKNGELLIQEVENANHFFRRFMGLMYRKGMNSNHGLLLTPCNEIHTFGMRFDIDAITLDTDNKVLLVDKCIPPNKVRSKVKGGHKVLELCAGYADKLGITEGDYLTFS
ncbi:MAG: DUF192 domain-containing protein [Eubacterium sp.]